MGAGFKTFTAGSILTASDVQNYLQDQSVMVFGGTAARSSAIGTANFEEGMLTYLTDVDKLQVYTGASFVDVYPAAATNQGLTLINTTSFSAVASQSVNSVFSSTYENYRIVFTTTNFSASDALTFRLRASGSDYSSANYSQMGTRNFSNSATIAALNESGRTSIGLGSTNSGASDRCGITIDIFKPNVNFTNKVMHLTIVNQDTSGLYLRTQGGLADGGTYVFDGFTFIIASGNMTGTVRTYGYNQ